MNYGYISSQKHLIVFYFQLILDDVIATALIWVLVLFSLHICRRIFGRYSKVYMYILEMIVLISLFVFKGWGKCPFQYMFFLKSKAVSHRSWVRGCLRRCHLLCVNGDSCFYSFASFFPFDYSLPGFLFQTTGCSCSCLLDWKQQPT